MQFLHETVPKKYLSKYALNLNIRVSLIKARRLILLTWLVALLESVGFGMAFKFLGFINRAGVDVYIITCLDCCFCVISVVTYSYIFHQYIKSQRTMPKARYILNTQVRI